MHHSMFSVSYQEKEPIIIQMVNLCINVEVTLKTASHF